jgi:hypothetical protein
LNNWKQGVDLEFIKTHCYSSGWETVACGIPRGTVLGPMLFNVYINDFSKIISEFTPYCLLMIPVVLKVTSPNYIELNQKLNPILHHISKWFQINQLVLKRKKTYIVKCTASEAPVYPLNIIHVDQTLAVTETIKFLSLHLNSHLSCMFQSFRHL